MHKPPVDRMSRQIVAATGAEIDYFEMDGGMCRNGLSPNFASLSNIGLWHF